MPFLATSMTYISAELEEIVVTAQKRSESLQEVPISIVAFSGDEIERLNISNTIDLVKNIPGMTGCKQCWLTTGCRLLYQRYWTGRVGFNNGSCSWDFCRWCFYVETNCQ